MNSVFGFLTSPEILISAIFESGSARLITVEMRGIFKFPTSLSFAVMSISLEIKFICPEASNLEIGPVSSMLSENIFSYSIRKGISSLSKEKEPEGIGNLDMLSLWDIFPSRLTWLKLSSTKRRCPVPSNCKRLLCGPFACSERSTVPDVFSSVFTVSFI